MKPEIYKHIITGTIIVIKKIAPKTVYYHVLGRTRVEKTSPKKLELLYKKIK